MFELPKNNVDGKEEEEMLEQSKTDIVSSYFVGYDAKKQTSGSICLKRHLDHRYLESLDDQ